MRKRCLAEFHPYSRFLPADGSAATLLPFRLSRLQGDRFLLTNISGDYCVLNRDCVHAFVQKRLAPSTDEYQLLKARHFLIDDTSQVALNLLAARYRTRRRLLPDLAALHIVVVTLRCNSACTYCHASTRATADAQFDMSERTSEQVVDFVFQTPSREIKIEFQGGEPLLRFDLVRHIIERAELVNRIEKRDLQFVICSNLSLIDDEILSYSAKHNVHFSTSLDGPRDLHNANRPMARDDGFERTCLGIHRIQTCLGPDRVSALMTTTRASLGQPEGIIDEYVRRGFNGIFLRKLNPYGLAAQAKGSFNYSPEEWLSFYKRALTYILQLNYQGVEFQEFFAALVLRRMLTCYGTGFVDLESPTGSGVSVLAYNYDGAVYAADEGRMLAAMGDETFRLGHVESNSYVDVLNSDRWLSLVRETMLEGVPGCEECAYLPWCGSDPVRHYRLQNDEVGHKPSSEWCKVHAETFRHLVLLLEDDEAAAEVLRTWA